MKDVKTYLRIASQEPTLSVNEKAISFPNPNVTQETTFLNEDEVRRLMILNRSGLLEDIEKNVLRGFLFTVFTGLRISDLYRADPVGA